MISVVVITGAMLAVLAVIWALVRPLGAVLQGPEEGKSREGEVNMEAFRALIDPKAEAYLRSTLPPDEFRKRQRERIRLAYECVRNIAANALRLVSVGERARNSSDPEVARAGRELVSLAFQTRINAFVAQCYLLLKWIVPGMTRCVLLKFGSYEEGLQRTKRLLQQGQVSKPDAEAHP